MQAWPLFEALVDRPLPDAATMQAWLSDWDALSVTVGEYMARQGIAAAAHTDDPEIEAAFLHMVREIRPKLAPFGDQLQRKLLDCPHAEALPSDWLPVLRNWRNQVSLFREANLPLFTKTTELAKTYDKAIGEMQVEIDGETLTLQQAVKREQDTDRSVREEAWRKGAARRLEDRDKLDAIFDELLGLRSQIAANAGEPDFRAYKFKSMNRFDYTPEDCLAFGEAIERVVVPRVEELDRQKAAKLGLDSLRPWDDGVDGLGDTPLQPFDAEQPEALREKSVEVFARTSAWMGELLSTLQPERNLDLMTRKGKRAGGFQSSLPKSGEPFIFMNAAGTSGDVRTMLHEAGHAFHFMLAYQAQPLSFLRGAPIEFCEVASMSMELCTLEHLQAFYPQEADLKRAQSEQLMRVLRILPWVATIDGFQHWLYTHPGHTRDERTAAWLGLTERFGTRHGGVGVDWSGLEAEREAYWQRQLHLFHIPFYYVDYGIAQLGALQLWLNYKQDAEAALTAYRQALSLGRTRSLPGLFEAAGVRFDFTEATLRPLVDAVWGELFEEVS